MANKSSSEETVISEIELSYTPKRKISDLPKVTTSYEVYEILLNSWDKSKLQFVEQFKVMLLNRAGRVLGICTLTTGSGSCTVVDPKLVFALALKANAGRIILAHNHPAGNLMPSKNDFDLTYKIKQAARLLEVQIDDHMIISAEGFYSFADEGAL